MTEPESTAEKPSAAAVIYSFPPAPAAAARAAGSLHLELLDGLRELVNHGDLAPGSRVPERELCHRFSVSRTPLREALKVLAAEGLVQLLPNRGARVAALEEEGLRDLFEVIGMLEAEAGRLACARMSDAAIAEVQSLHYRMYAHFLREELPEYFQLNQAIHQAILVGAENPVLVNTHRNLAGRIIRARYMSNRLRPDRWKAAVEEHGRILDALVRRDGEALAVILKAHLANKRDIITEYIRSLAEEQAEKPVARRKRRPAEPRLRAPG
jgi:DNA-binding GntR family transcriptional regulator